MIRNEKYLWLILSFVWMQQVVVAQKKPNIVFIMADEASVMFNSVVRRKNSVVASYLLLIMILTATLTQEE